MWLAPQMSRRSGRFPNDGGYDGSGWAGAIAAKQNLPSGQFGLEGGLGPPPNPNPVQHQVRVGDWDPGSRASMFKPEPATGIVAGPFGKSLRQENPYRPSPPRRGPGGFGGGGFGGGSQGIDQFMDFMQQMMDMFKQFNSQGGGGGGYGQRRGPGEFPQPPQQYGQREYQPQPAILRTQGPESLMGQIRTDSIGMPQLHSWGGPSGRERSLGLMQTAGPESIQAQFRTAF